MELRRSVAGPLSSVYDRLPGGCAKQGYRTSSEYPLKTTQHSQASEKYTEDMMWLVLLLILFAVPLCAHAQNVGDLSPNPNNNNSIGNPFSPGGPWSPSGQGNPNVGRTAPTSPYSWSNVAPLPGSSRMPDRVNSFPLRSPNTLAPNVPGSSLGPYGITLPPNHPLGLDVR